MQNTWIHNVGWWIQAVSPAVKVNIVICNTHQSHSVKLCYSLGASLVAQTVKNLPAMWETWVGSLGWEDPLEEGMATHSSILAWKISWTEEPGGLQSTGSQKVRHDWMTKHSTAQADFWTFGRSDFRARWVFMTFLGMLGGGDTCHFRCHFLSFILDELEIYEAEAVNYF